LKELAVVGKYLADNSDRCAGIQEGLHSDRFRDFKAKSTPAGNNIR
jgi:hypothetical protein